KTRFLTTDLFLTHYIFFVATLTAFPRVAIIGRLNFLAVSRNSSWHTARFLPTQMGICLQKNSIGNYYG
ncbi:MAG: hypothetical protein KDE31_21435, partial [Caldilineaceae bacterium]|nr:hypothetical protein [Caldilineaceae bacterium]